MAEALYYIFNIVWAWKLNHNKNSKNVSPITHSQTAHAQICTDMLGHETNRNTAVQVVCRTALW